MITKEQWDYFVNLVYLTKCEGFRPFMKGQIVYEVDLDDKAIVTIKRNEPRVRYKHPESLSSYTKLDNLYALVTFSDLSLLQIKKFPPLLETVGWQTGLPPKEGFYYVRGLLHEDIGGDSRPVYVNPKYFCWAFSENDDPEWISLDHDIDPENIQWKYAPPWFLGS